MIRVDYDPVSMYLLIGELPLGRMVWRSCIAMPWKLAVDLDDWILLATFVGAVAVALSVLCS